jgi:hypothetical protein
MSKIAIIGVILVGAAVVAEKSLEIPIARLTLKAVDEQGNPVADAHVRMSFEGPLNWNGSSSQIVSVTGITDQNGAFSGEGHSFDTKGGLIQKAGYYSSSPESYKFEKVIGGKWQPWNPTLNVVLKRIINPIPMYARKAQIEVPEAAESAPVGFDLEAGDWVAPHGKGVTSDFLVSLKRQFTDRRNYEAGITITFPNKGDGLQPISPEDVNSGSELKLPRTAPEEGYEPKLATTIGAKAGGPGHEDAQANRSYFIRTRTVLDSDGNVKSARYGKIDGDIRLDAINSKTCIMLFTYYFNPTANDRNMEFDPKKNLSANLTADEQVTAP